LRKRGVQAAGNAPSEDRKYWQGVELCIHGLRSWGCNLSRKVRATRSSSLCSAHLARITRCKFLQPLRYLCQFMYLTTVKLVLRNSFDLNYLRKMCGTWVSRAFGVPWISDFSGRYFRLDPLTSVDQDQREMARSPRSITPTPSLLNDAMPTSDAIPTSESASTPGKNCYSRDNGAAGLSCAAVGCEQNK